MRVRNRGLDANERADLWHRWRAGQSLSEISRSLERSVSGVFNWIADQGGISPPACSRGANTLTLQEREEISRAICRGESFREIARGLRRPASTISREVARNGGRLRYRATDADAAAWGRAKRPKRCKLAQDGYLRRCVAFKLSQNWSPEQISGWLRQRYPNDKRMRISHETIYRSLFIQARGVLKEELQSHLRTGRRYRHSKKATAEGQPRRGIIDAISISERPPDVEDRAVPGHWEGDLLCGSKSSHIATLVERRSRFTMLVKLASKDAGTVAGALKKQITKLPTELRRSLTWDRGLEMALHHSFTVATNVKVYFCDPQSPWQRGTNENTNGLLRQYFPNGSDLSSYTQTELNRVARQLNERPRKTLGFRTPADTLYAGVAATG